MKKELTIVQRFVAGFIIGFAIILLLTNCTKEITVKENMKVVNVSYLPFGDVYILVRPIKEGEIKEQYIFYKANGLGKKVKEYIIKEK